MRLRRQRFADAAPAAPPGRYYAVVSVHNATAGNYTLERQSRTITQTHALVRIAKASRANPSAWTSASAPPSPAR